MKRSSMYSIVASILIGAVAIPMDHVLAQPQPDPTPFAGDWCYEDGSPALRIQGNGFMTTPGTAGTATFYRNVEPLNVVPECLHGSTFKDGSFLSNTFIMHRGDPDFQKRGTLFTSDGESFTLTKSKVQPHPDFGIDPIDPKNWIEPFDPKVAYSKITIKATKGTSTAPKLDTKRIRLFALGNGVIYKGWIESPTCSDQGQLLLMGKSIRDGMDNVVNFSGQFVDLVQIKGENNFSNGGYFSFDVDSTKTPPVLNGNLVWVGANVALEIEAK